jgi:RNA polymerase sigma-70 factor, ECF subfamily
MTGTVSNSHPGASLAARLFQATPATAGKPADTDAALMLRVKHGDFAAFEKLVNHYQQPVINFIYRTLPDAAEAEDLAQVVFLQVFKSASRYHDSARFTTWLFTIARNVCLNELRRRSRHPADSLDEMHSSDDGEWTRQVNDPAQRLPSDLALRGELETKVEQAVATLPENQRTAILLYTMQDFSYEEIAGVLDCSLQATKSLIFRARETLKRRLKPYLRNGAWSASQS